MLYEPLDQWEETQGECLTDTAYNEKQEAVRKEYFEVFWNEVHEILLGWGIETPAGVVLGATSVDLPD
jgi:hypothetical protein